MAYRASRGEPQRCTDGKRTYYISGYRRIWPTQKPHIYWCKVRRRWIVRYFGRITQRIHAMQLRFYTTACNCAAAIWENHYGPRT